MNLAEYDSEHAVSDIISLVIPEITFRGATSRSLYDVIFDDMKFSQIITLEIGTWKKYMKNYKCIILYKI